MLNSVKCFMWIGDIESEDDVFLLSISLNIHDITVAHKAIENM